MTQSLILITTLAVMAGLGVGYWLGWLSDPKSAVRFCIVYTSGLMDDMYKKQLDLGAMIK